jgi:hypothetical protein
MPVKLHIAIRKKRSKLWEWQYTNPDGKYYAGLCRTQRDSVNDASIIAGLRWEQATDDMQTANIGNEMQLCCTRGYTLTNPRRVNWELQILSAGGVELSKTNVFASEAEAKCCAPAFLHQWRNDRAAIAKAGGAQ